MWVWMGVMVEWRGEAQCEPFVPAHIMRAVFCSRPMTSSSTIER